MDVLSWSRHHRLFPGEGSFDLPAFVGHVLRAGYTGPMSLEVFNDTFRQTDVLRTAQQAKRSLTWLEDQVARLADCGRGAPTRPTRLPDVGQPVGLRLRRGQGRGRRRGRRAAAAARVHLPRPPPQQAGAPVDPGRGAGGLQRAAGPRLGADARRHRVRGRRPGGLGRSAPAGSTRRRCSGGPTPASRSWPPSGPRTAPRSSSPTSSTTTPAWVPEFEGGDEPGERARC